MRKTSEGLGSISKLDTDSGLIMEREAELQEIVWLKEKLRAVPYWREGHRRLALLGLNQGDSAMAYASALAVKKLSGSPEALLEGEHLVGKSLLQGGDPQRALPFLKKVSPESTEAAEDLAAAYLALGSLREAYSTLSELPRDALSPASKEAYLYLRDKLND
ncbi:MAG: tetratricopeptide repeat protein [Deltaproteobacteria bacterium]|nr:tetratricopeptide repeat protein [Deltaproteobacteria bacterium]